MLGTHGLSSSEGKTVANFLKELVKGIDVTHDNLKVSTASTTRDGEVFSMDTNTKLDWKKQLYDKAKYYSLSTWLNEAIQLKESMIQTIRQRVFVTTVESEERPPAPITPDTDFKKDYLPTLNTKELAEYWNCQAVSAHIGKFVHGFDTVREKLDNHKPVEFKTISPTETITIKNTLMYTPKAMYEDFDELQSVHREANKNINYHLAKHKEWENKLMTKYNAELADHLSAVKDITLRYNTAVQRERATFENSRIKDLEEVSALKIIIPNELQPILDEVYKKLG